MVTPQQNLGNLGSATNVVAHEMGLDQAPPSEWSQGEHVAFIRALANKILQYPAQFDAQTLNSATVILGQNFNGMLLDDFVNSAPDGSASVAKIFIDSLGDGIFSVAQSPANLGAGAVALVNKVANIASNVGDAADRLAAAAADSSKSLSWLLPVGLIALVAILALNTEERYERRIRGALA